MSVNYYLDDTSHDENHIGKWAAGRFIGYAPEGVNSFDDWAARLDGHRIFAEHGIEYTKDEMIEAAKERGPMARFNGEYGRTEYFTSEGVQFSRRPFC